MWNVGRLNVDITSHTQPRTILSINIGQRNIVGLNKERCIQAL